MIRLDHDGRLIDLRIVSTADGERRGIEATLDDRAMHDLPPGATRASNLGRAVVFGTTTAVFMNLPRLREDIPAHLPLLAAWAKPWPGRVSVYRSPTADAFRLLTTSDRRATIGTLAETLSAGPTSRFDLGNALVVTWPAAPSRASPTSPCSSAPTPSPSRLHPAHGRSSRPPPSSSSPLDATVSPGCCAASAGPSGRWRPPSLPARA